MGGQQPTEAEQRQLDKMIEDAQKVLADTFALLHKLHYKRGQWQAAARAERGAQTP